MIREATFPNDLKLVRRLFREYVTELGVDLDFQGFEAELAGLPGRYAPPSGALLLWDQGACVALRDLGDGVCEMKRLYVQPSIRRDGAGRALTAAIVSRGRSLGYSSMVLDTLEHMTPAQNLYASLGFERCEAYYDNPLSDVVYMRLAFTPEV
jgi:ribosomal protein S18 acetylase RimI-like enzyme